MLPIDLPIKDSVSSAMKHAADTAGVKAIVKSVADSAVTPPLPDPSFWSWINETATGNIVAIAGFFLTIAGLIAGYIFWKRRPLNHYFLKGKSFRAHQLKYRFFDSRTESVYARREVEDEIIKKINANRNVLLLGTPLKGKTRTMVECLRQIKNACYIIPHEYAEFTGEINFPRKRWFTKKQILVVDDLQEFFKKPESASLLINKAQQQGIRVFATCRSSGEWLSVCRAYDTLSKIFDVTEMPPPNDAEINDVVAKNKLGERPTYFDKENIGSLIIDLDTMRQRYASADNNQKKILLCIKELIALGISNEKGEIDTASVITLAAKAHDLSEAHNEIEKHKQWLIDNDFTKPSHGGIKPVTFYFDEIVEKGYAAKGMIENGLKAFEVGKINFANLVYSAADTAEANGIVQFIKKKGVKPDIVVYNQLLAKQADFDAGYKVYEEIIKEGLSANEQTYYTLINFHINEIEKADDRKPVLFNTIKEKFVEMAAGKDNDWEFHFYNALTLYCLAKEESNIELFKRACDAYSKSAELNAIAVTFYNLGLALADWASVDDENKTALLKEAYDMYKKATEINPKYADAFYNWGNALANWARVDDGNKIAFLKEACDMYKKATEINPKYDSAFYNWGNALADLARVDGENKIALFKEACDMYKKATEINPKDDGAFNNRGVALADWARVDGENKIALFKEACDMYNKATEINPKDDGAFYNWGNALADLARVDDENKIALFKEACDMYKKATEINPKYASAFNNRGNALANWARVDDENKIAFLKEACDMYKKATEINPNYAGAFYNRGVALADWARVDDENKITFLKEACDMYKKVTEINPEYFQAFYNWGSALEGLAQASNNDAGLMQEGKEKKAIAIRLRPDLFDEEGNIRG